MYTSSPEATTDHHTTTTGPVYNNLAFLESTTTNILTYENPNKQFLYSKSLVKSTGLLTPIYIGNPNSTNKTPIGTFTKAPLTTDVPESRARGVAPKI